MSTLYLFALAGVCLMFFVALIEAVSSVSRKAPWDVPRHRLELVKTVDRRVENLPFIGPDRRAGSDDRLPGALDGSRRRA